MGEQRRALVIDDNVEYALLFSTILKGAGFEVASVNDPAAGLSRVRNEPFHIVLLDNNFEGRALPGQSLVAVLKRQSGAKVIMLTASLDPRTKVEAVAAGVDAFLTKPVEAEVLLSTVERVLGAPPPPAARGPVGS